MLAAASGLEVVTQLEETIRDNILVLAPSTDGLETDNKTCDVSNAVKVGVTEDTGQAAPRPPTSAIMPAMPCDFDGGRWYVAWKVLGPFGKKHPAIAEATVTGLPTREKSDSRASMKQSELEKKNKAGFRSGCSPIDLSRASDGVFVSSSEIDMMDIEMQRHRELKDERKHRIKELSHLLELIPNDPEAKSELITLLRSKPPPVPSIEWSHPGSCSKRGPSAASSAGSVHSQSDA